MKDALRSHSAIVMVLAAVIFAGGLVLIVGTVSTLGLRNALNPRVDPEYSIFTEITVIVGAVMSLGAVVVGGLALLWIEATEREIERPPTHPYSMALIGMGYALIVIGSLQFVVLAGFTSEGQLAGVLGQGAAEITSTETGAPSGTNATGSGKELPGADPAADGPEERRRNILAAVRLLLLPGFAILGGLFFVAGALSKKQDMLVEELLEKGVDTFDYHRFWAGVSYRMGEAIVFALVVFLFVQWNENTFNPTTERMVLLSALILGMFVKPAELLINGLAQRMFAAIDAFVK